MATASDLISRALKKIGVMSLGASLDSLDSTDALAELNSLLSMWSAAPINLHYRKEESFSLVVGDGQYSIGSAGDFNTARPAEIEQAFIRDSANHDFPLKIRPISEYWDLGEKTASTRPTRLYYDPTYPTGTIYFNTLPAEAETLHLVSQKPLTSLILTDTVSLPGEYENAVVNRLAINLAPYYGKSISAELALSDKISYGVMTSRNLANSMKVARVSAPGRTRGTYNIDSDE